MNFKESQVDPVTRLTYLGFILDSSTMTISLPEEKIEKITLMCSQLHYNMSIEEAKMVFTGVQRLRRLGRAIIRFAL